MKRGIQGAEERLTYAKMKTLCRIRNVHKKMSGVESKETRKCNNNPEHILEEKPRNLKGNICEVAKYHELQSKNFTYRKASISNRARHPC